MKLWILDCLSVMFPCLNSLYWVAHLIQADTLAEAGMLVSPSPWEF